MLKNHLKALFEIPKKRAFLISKGFYRTLAGGWCDSHCMGTVSEREYLFWTLGELKENYPHYIV